MSELLDEEAIRELLRQLGERLTLLCSLLGVMSVSQVFDIANEVWGPGMLRDESVFLVTQALRERGFVD